MLSRTSEAFSCLHHGRYGQGAVVELANLLTSADINNPAGAMYQEGQACMSLMYQAVQHLIVSGPAKENLAASALGVQS